MSETEVNFTVYGIPVPEGSVKSIPVRLKGGKWSSNVIHQNSDKLNAYRNSIKKVADQYVSEIYSDNDNMGYELFVRFYVPKPKTVKRVLPTVRPDLDKYVRAVGDALTSTFKKNVKKWQGFWDDDCQIVDLWARKLYCDEEHPLPCTVIRVRKVLMAHKMRRERNKVDDETETSYEDEFEANI